MAIKVITAANTAKLRQVLTTLQDDEGYIALVGLIGMDYNDPVQCAIEAATNFVKAGKPFTYEDIGLSYEKRKYRPAFQQWAASNNIEFRRTKSSGKGGSKAAMFFPFQVDEAGQKMDQLPDAQEEF